MAAVTCETLSEVLGLCVSTTPPNTRTVLSVRPTNSIVKDTLGCVPGGGVVQNRINGFSTSLACRVWIETSCSGVVYVLLLF